MTLLNTYPTTRINDLFASENSDINFASISEDCKDPIVKGLPNVEYRFNSDFYNKIGVDIVAETVFDYPYPYITEKTYRSMASLRPFIIVGAYHTLKFLKENGFKTFSAIINESYDDIQHPESRFYTVCDSIKTFVDQPLEDVKQDLYKITDVLTHNRAHLLNLSSIQLEKFKAQINNV